MDSLSQFVLGAAIGTAVLAPRIGARKAVLAGGILATLPDLDVLIRHVDPVDNFILHRSFSHSLIMHALATPVLGEGLRLLFKGLRDARFTAWAAVFLCLATHALLDAMTIYGTQLLWPLTDYPFGTGSMFIIDPLYTLPLFVAAIWALIAGGHGRRLMRVNAAALILSTAYLGWSALAQQIVERRAAALVAEAGLVAERIWATPAPLTTLGWKTLVLDEQGDRYLNLYMPVFGSPEVTEIHSHPRNLRTLGCGMEGTQLQRLAAFSKGYFRLDEVDGKIVLSDLRMGLTPNYAFRFALRDATGPLSPTEKIDGIRAADGDGDWLYSLIAGRPSGRMQEGTPLTIADLAKPPAHAVASLGHGLGATPGTC